LRPKMAFLCTRQTDGRKAMLNGVGHNKTEVSSELEATLQVDI